MFKPDWKSISLHKVPAWLTDCKFGIYTHWGVYSVPACGPNATWYPYNMYRDGSLQNLYHRLKFGEVKDFDYKNFIPQFKAKKFNADEWAELFKKSGAGFAGPVGEHHEGFSMWKTKFNKYNSVDMGPKRDILAELSKSIRGQGMKFMVAMHHAETWYFDINAKSEYREPNPYISNHGKLWPVWERPSKEFLDNWLNKTKEVTDNYCPDLFWFDFGLRYVQEDYKKEMVSYYYNKLNNLKKEGIITYKWHNLVVGSGIEDLEQGTREDLAYNFWVTDTTVDDGEAWGYIYNNSYKTPSSLIHYLVDNVSKNGALILSIGPRSDGTIPDEAKHILLEMGKWLSINGEAIYGTTPWIFPGEGPTKLKRTGAFSEMDKLKYTEKDIRFTLKGNVLYAICLGKPGKEVLIKSLHPYIYKDEIASIELLGFKGKLKWKFDEEGLLVEMPENITGNYAYSIKIVRNNLLKS